MSDVNALFAPYRLKDLELANRVVMAPMTRARSPGGTPTPEVAAYYRRRAEGGVGLIITEAVAVERPASFNEPNVPLMYGSEALAGWKSVVDEVHAAGGRIMAQLWHVGLKRSNNAPDWVSPAPYESPSGLSLQGEPVGEPMSDVDVADTIDAFARAAADAKRLGFDGVELHAGHNYLINQFFSADLNRRDDAYGGRTLMERSRFAIDVLGAVRRAVGPAFPVVFRFSQWTPKDFDARMVETPDALARWISVLIDAGADAFDCSQRHYWDAAFPEYDPDMNMAGWVKKLTGATSLAVGSVGLSGDVYSTLAGKSFKPAPLAPLLARLERGEFDLVVVGRALLQDPEWLKKVGKKSNDFYDFTPAALKSLS